LLEFGAQRLAAGFGDAHGALAFLAGGDLGGGLDQAPGFEPGQRSVEAAGPELSACQRLDRRVDRVTVAS